MTDAREQARGGGLLSGQGFGFAIMAVFFLVMMLALVAGVIIFRGVSERQETANVLRMESGFITNLVRMGDMADAVQTGEGPEGDALVLVTTLPSGVYETRIYHYNGAIVQEYAAAGLPYDPELAVCIVESATFEFSFVNGLLTVTTDDGDFPVALRSVQGAQAKGGGA